MAIPKVEAFKDMLLANLREYMAMSVKVDAGRIRLTKTNALEIFKIVMGTPIQFLLRVWESLGVDKLPDKEEEVTELEKSLSLTIHGVAGYRIVLSKPRLTSHRTPLLTGIVKWVPHFRMKPARRVRDLLTKVITGVDPEEIRAKTCLDKVALKKGDK